MKTASVDRIVERGLLATALVAVAVRLVQYLANGSLGLDELALSRNIVDRSFAELLGQPLDYGQVAPMGFLAVQKTVTVVLGDSEAALRLLPLVASLALVPVFFWVARRFLEGATLFAGCAVFSIAYGFVSYAAAAKQYSTDLLAATALVGLAMLVVERRFESRPCLALAAAGVPLLLLSFSAVPIAAGLGGLLLVMWWLHDEDLPGTGIAVVLVDWGLAASVNVVAAFRNVSRGWGVCLLRRGPGLCLVCPKGGLGDFEQGRCHRGDVRAYLRELDRFRGGTVWVVFTHVRDVFDELDPIQTYLRAIGTETAHIEGPGAKQGSGAVFAYRFDLSSPAQLSSITAEQFEVHSKYQGDPRAVRRRPAADF